MASSYLVVHVVDANVPSSSNASSVSYYLEVRFNGQSARTETKEDAVWNQTIRFHMRDEQQGDDDGDHPSVSGGLVQEVYSVDDYHRLVSDHELLKSSRKQEQRAGDHDDYLHPSGDPNLEAPLKNKPNLEFALYSIDVTSSSESLIGEAVVDNKDFDRHSSKAGLFPHDLMKNRSSHGQQALVTGKLTLRLFRSAADDKALFDIHARKTDGGVDTVNRMLKLFLPSKDQSNRKEETTVTRSSKKENTSTSSRPLRGNEDISPRTIEPVFDRGKVVERMQFLFVVVVKARGLPDVDAYGLLDPFVEVNFGAHNMGVTKCLKRDDNPEWNKTFALFLPSGKAPSSPGVDVIVKDKDLVRDDIVGKLYFYFKDIPTRQPDDAQPEPTWHPLLDQHGKATLGKASLLLAIWIGSQDDEAYRHAWESPYGPKVYENPWLWCLRVTVVEVQGVVACDEAANGVSDISLKDELFCKVCLGEQVRMTRPAAKTMQTASSGSYEWREDDLVFIAALPFFESNLQVYVVAASSSGGQDQEVIGETTIPLADIDRLDVAAYGHDEPFATRTPQWFDLKNPHQHPHSDQQGIGGNMSHMRIRLRILLDGGYHIASHDPQGQEYMMDDTRPAERQLWGPPVGQLHLGILSATGLRRHTTDGDDGTSSAQPNPYCVAKYGDKWVRTRTIKKSSDPVFNEQYTWDVYDIATVLTVGVLDFMSSTRHHRIGKVRIPLCTLKTGQMYAHAYSLITLSPSGPIKTGELSLALKFSLPSTINMLRVYTRPTLPRMHYVQPLKQEQEDFFAAVRSSDTGGKLWSQAAKILALRLHRIEPPLREEVVSYMCNVESSWSLRRSKANFNRLTALASPVMASLRWFECVRSWRNPLVSLLVHAVLVSALCFHGLVLPLLLVCVGLAGVWNYRYRPQSRTGVDLLLSHVYMAHPDELDEEFDTYPTSQRNDDLVKMRYDRLRSIAGRIQTIVGDVATLFERIQSLLSWKEPRATAIFMMFLLISTAVLFLVPYKLLLAVAGFYIMRPPRFRSKMPSIFMNFLRRLPDKHDVLIT